MSEPGVRIVEGVALYSAAWLDADGPREERHEAGRVVASRAEGGRRTTFYGYCSCGRGTSSSANRASVEKKLRDHASGDDRGMF